MIEEDEDDEYNQNGIRDDEPNPNAHSQKLEFKDTDPEVQNAKLL